MQHDSNRRAKVRRWGPVAASAVALLGGITGCGDGDRPSEQPMADAKTVDATYSIKAYATKDGKRTLVKFPPVGAAASMPKEDRDALASVMDGAGMAMAIHSEDSGATETTVGAGGADWELARYALRACVREMQEETGWFIPYGIAAEAWIPGHFHLLPASGLANCDQLLMAQEVMVCAADKLGQIADTVSPLTWNVESFSQNSSYYVTFPPQAMRDKFVARDMAMNVLAHLARLGEVRPGSAGEPMDDFCLESWVMGATLPVESGLEGWLTAFGETIFNGDTGGLHADYLTTDGTDTQYVNVDNVGEVCSLRLSHAVHIYRAAGRLLKELVEKNVEADLAGAEEANAGAADPALGLRRTWGREAVPGAGYNSRAHALSTLFGRLELGVSPDGYHPLSADPWESSKNDPECSGTRSFFAQTGYGAVSADDPLLFEGERPSLVTWLGWSGQLPWEDVPPSSATQSRAATLLADSGILVDDVALEPVDSSDSDGCGGPAILSRANRP